jgi:hypothetical protein
MSSYPGVVFLNVLPGLISRQELTAVNSLPVDHKNGSCVIESTRPPQWTADWGRPEGRPLLSSTTVSQLLLANHIPIIL